MPLHVSGFRQDRGEALAWAAEIARGATQAIGRTKRLLHEASSRGLSGQREREGFAEGMYGPEGAEGLAAFLEKRKPRFHSQRAPRCAGPA